MSKKYYSIVGMIIGTVLAIVGIMTLSGKIGGNTETASTASIYYDSGYARFGSDFYTYIVNNAQEAASASRVIASNQNVIYAFLRQIFGISMIALGLFMNCIFGIKFVETKAEKYLQEDNSTEYSEPQETVMEEEEFEEESDTEETLNPDSIEEEPIEE